MDASKSSEDSNSNEVENQYEALGMGSEESDSAEYQISPNASTEAEANLDDDEQFGKIFEADWKRAQGIPTNKFEEGVMRSVGLARFDQKYKEEVELSIRMSRSGVSSDLEDFQKILLQIASRDESPLQGFQLPTEKEKKEEK